MLFEIPGVPEHATGDDCYTTVAHIRGGRAALTGDTTVRPFNPFSCPHYEGQRLAVLQTSDGRYLIVDTCETIVAPGEKAIFPTKFLPWVMGQFDDEDAAIAAACMID